MPLAAEQLDSRTQVVTPENIAFEYRAAGPFSRIGAYLLDIGIQLLVVFLTVLLFYILVLIIFLSAGVGGVTGLSPWGMLGNLGVLSIFVLWFLMQWFYGAWFELRWNGQTPGKRSLGLRVLRTDGQPIGAAQAVLRNLIRLLDAQPIMPLPEVLLQILLFLCPLAAGSQLVALTSMACTKRHQRLGDLVCGTMVVAEDRSFVGKVEPVLDPAIAQLQEAIPANYIPSRTLSKALAHYIGRRRYFGPARRQEIARHVGVVLIEKLNLPPGTDCDLLLCALYNRAFRADAFDPNLVKEQPPAPQPTQSADAAREAAAELLSSSK